MILESLSRFGTDRSQVILRYVQVENIVVKPARVHFVTAQAMRFLLISRHIVPVSPLALGQHSAQETAPVLAQQDLPVQVFDIPLVLHHVGQARRICRVIVMVDKVHLLIGIVRQVEQLVRVDRAIHVFEATMFDHK